ncbi:hypothetical protein FRC06_009632, partial [Ceratobasidium sp. 370]
MNDIDTGKLRAKNPQPSTVTSGNTRGIPKETDGSENAALVSNGINTGGQAGHRTDLDAEARELSQPTAPAQPYVVERGVARPSATSIRTATVQVQTQSGADSADPSQEAAILEEIGNLHTRQYQQRGQLQDIN